MQIIATGKWSKADKEWKMVLALRQGKSGRPTSGPVAGPERRPAPTTRDRRPSDD